MSLSPPVTITPHDDSEVGRSFTFSDDYVHASFLTSAGYRQPSVEQDHSKLDLNRGGRGYMMDARDWRDIEMTAYLRVSSSSNEEIMFIVRGGTLSSSRPCEGCGYKLGIHHTNGSFRIKKARYHPADALNPWISSGAGRLDHWVGFKLVAVNRIVGGKHCVLIEVWVDANNSNSWIKKHSMLDDGYTLCVTGTSCGDASTCQIINWGGPKATFEINDNGAVSIAKCSIREISYDGSFGSTPPPPPSTGQPPTPPPPVEGENPSGKFIIQPGNITASGNDGNVPANTYDSNLDTRWASNPIPQWISYDLGAVRRISSIGIHWYRPVIPDPTPPPPPTPPPGSPPPSPPSPPGSLIEGGVRMFYPKKATGGNFYFSSSTAGRSQWISETGHCFVNLEVTSYFYIHGVDNDGEELSIKVRGSCHGCNSDNCGRCYIMGVGYDGSVNAQYEEPHPNNHPYSIHGKGGAFNPGSSMIGKWFGAKAICYLDGSHDHLEFWLDTSGLNSSGQPINNWRKFWELNVTEFTGRCNSSGCEKGDLVFFRMDDVTGDEQDAVDVKFATSREIIV